MIGDPTWKRRTGNRGDNLTTLFLSVIGLSQITLLWYPKKETMLFAAVYFKSNVSQNHLVSPSVLNTFENYFEKSHLLKDENQIDSNWQSKEKNRSLGQTYPGDFLMTCARSISKLAIIILKICLNTSRCTPHRVILYMSRKILRRTGKGYDLIKQHRCDTLAGKPQSQWLQYSKLLDFGVCQICLRYPK